MELSNAVMVGKLFMEHLLREGMVVVDGTAGNGNDTLFLRQKVGEQGKVYSFDIQTTAINNTRSLLEKHNCTAGVFLIQDSHRNVADHIKEERVDFAIFNLGYLPGGDKKITTDPETLLTALHGIFPILRKNGTIFLIAYPGHTAGKKENEQLEIFLSSLPQTDFTVSKTTFLNQRGDPAIFYFLQKR